MNQLLDDVAQVEMLGTKFADTYHEVLQCTSEQQSLSAALDALAQPQLVPSEQHKPIWVKRPGGVIIALTREQAQNTVRQDLSECKQRLSLLQQQQKELTEALSERGDPGQALLNAVL